MRNYNPHEIEQKWQARWQAEPPYAPSEAGRPRYYLLLMFPYPSGPLHCGHWYMYAPPDAKARYLRMKGHDVLFPMGFDAFGLPAENAAIKRKIHPRPWTLDNVARMRESFRLMGASFDWSREVVTCDPGYYKWTQWLFLELYRRGLAYRARAPVDWCPGCNTTLAREQIVGDERTCERCGTPVFKRDMDQWFFKITEYADELLDYGGTDWPERVVTMQTNWIGRSEGADILFRTESGDDLEVFTTRADTVGGATFLAVAPEHPRLAAMTEVSRRPAVEAYVEQARRQSEIQRLAVNAPKTGVFTGAHAINPVTGERVPVYVADYVLMHHGTGAVMGVPAHDDRDFGFARDQSLPVRVVVAPPGWTGAALSGAYTDDGLVVDSGPFDGLTSEAARREVADWLARRGLGRRSVRYRMRDWLVSRQRYWGAPIPIIHCQACGAVPVPVEALPVVLPEDVDFVPTGESPLKGHPGFRQTECPACGGPAERETDTLDTFVDSSWYWYRYLSPDRTDVFHDKADGARWLPVAEYAGGVEHATMHLLYARFFARALADLGHVADREPFRRVFNQGLVLGEDGEKMSKRSGNVVDPQEVVRSAGTDVFRGFLMFLGPWSRGGPWSSEGMVGISRFYQKVWSLVMEEAPSVAGEPDADRTRALRRRLHRTIRKVGEDIEAFNFNTALSALMELSNDLVAARRSPVAGTEAWATARKALIVMLAPFAPHLSEELWEASGERGSVHRSPWPVFDPAAVEEDRFTLVIQVDGKLRGRLEVPRTISEGEARALALESEAVRRFVGAREIERAVYVPRRLINLILK